MLLDEHIPEGLGRILEALGHHVESVIGLGRRARGDGEHVRSLDDLGLDWFLTSDQFREPHVWADVYTALGDEGRGRVLRLRPGKAQKPDPSSFIAYLARYIVDPYDELMGYMANRRVALIDLGRGTKRGSRGPRALRAYTRPEVAQILQQGLFNSGGPRRSSIEPRRGRNRRT